MCAEHPPPGRCPLFALPRSRLPSFNADDMSLSPVAKSLSSLPDALAQSIAHFLTTKERLRLARCSRQNRLMAEASFAWIGADPITVPVDAGVNADPLPSGPLLRFIPIGLVWHGCVERDAIARHIHIITAVADRAHVVALTLHTAQWLDDALAGQLLQAPGLQRLETMTLWAHTHRLIELACQLPLLATLVLWSSFAAADASLLVAAPSLTDLTVTQAGADPDCLSSVLPCPKLRRLAVVGFRVADLQTFSQEPGWQQLRELYLLSDSWDVLSADTWAAAFSSLRSLRVLTLSGEKLDPPLAHVHRIPLLRRLIIQCDYGCAHPPHSNRVLRSLLHSSPTLRVEWLAAAVELERVGSMLRPLVAMLGAQLLHREERISPHCSQVRFRLARVN